MLGGGTPQRQSDLTQVMFVVRGDLIEFVPQGAHAVYAVHELQVATSLIVLAGVVDDRIANGLVHTPGDVERDSCIVQVVGNVGLTFVPACSMTRRPQITSKTPEARMIPPAQ